MVMRIICFVVISLMLAVPVSASSVDEEGASDGTVANSAAAASDQEVTETSVSAQEANSVAPLAVADGDLAGGYYFVADCALGSDIKFYVPLEWAHDVFTIDSSGNLVNLSNSTCYAYCPDYPSYTFSCSRFNSFTYRASNYDTSDLEITDISETNMSFMDSNTFMLSDQDFQLLIAALIFVVAGLIIIRRA